MKGSREKVSLTKRESRSMVRVSDGERDVRHEGRDWSGFFVSIKTKHYEL